MSLDIHQSEREGIVILELKGRITAGPEVTSFRDSIQALASAMRFNVIIDLKHADYIDSTGLGALVLAATSFRKSGGVVKLVHLNRRNIELLVMTKLTTVFDVFTDEQDAVNSFFPDRKVKAFDILTFVREQQQD